MSHSDDLRKKNKRDEWIIFVVFWLIVTAIWIFFAAVNHSPSRQSNVPEGECYYQNCPPEIPDDAGLNPYYR